MSSIPDMKALDYMKKRTPGCKLQIICLIKQVQHVCDYRFADDKNHQLRLRLRKIVPSRNKERVFAY